MNELDFTIEFTSDVLDEGMEAELLEEADSRLRKLADGHKDMIGAAITIWRAAHGETPHLYEAKVVVYIRPENIAGTEKEDNPTAALKGALKAVERQVREKRAKLSRRWEQPGNDPVAQEVTEVMAAEDDAIL
jgi:ribosome-associated translation inhibitor RaiA